MPSQGFILSLTMKTLIKYNLPFLNLQDSKEIVLGRFKQAQCDWLAVVDQERFLGMVSLEVLSALEFNSLEELSYTFIPDAVLSETHWYNYGLNFRKLQMTMAAVVTKEGAFMGYIFENDFKRYTETQVISKYKLHKFNQFEIHSPWLTNNYYSSSSAETISPYFSV